MSHIIVRMLKHAAIHIRYLKKRVSLANSCEIGGIDTAFEGDNFIGAHTSFHGYIGYKSYISADCSIDGKIGRFCSIAPYVRVITGRHPTSDFVSTHPCFYSIKYKTRSSFVKTQKFRELKYAEGNYSIVVGNDVWIGYGAMIDEGITVGDGAIIAAGAVVTKDVPPYSIVGGIPAKIIRYRFDEEVVNSLLRIKWWNKDEEWIKSHVESFENITVFLDKLKNEDN